MDDTAKNSSVKNIRRAIMDLVARREHSCKEILQKLSRKGFDPTLIQTTIDQCIEENLISETRFIENYIYSRQKKGFGPLHIREALRQRGIHDDQLKIYFILEDTIWFELAKIAWEKRFKNRPPKDLHEQAKHKKFLQSRGFTHEQIKESVCSEKLTK